MDQTATETAPAAATVPPQESPREIFRYWNGTRKRGVDPLAALRTLLTHPEFNAETDPALAEAGDPEASARALGAIRSAFQVAAWSEDDAGNQSGMTERETMAILYEFQDYIETLKKNISQPLTSPPATDSTASAPATAAPAVAEVTPPPVVGPPVISPAPAVAAAVAPVQAPTPPALPTSEPLVSTSTSPDPKPAEPAAS